jgi:hypothetical protein
MAYRSGGSQVDLDQPPDTATTISAPRRGFIEVPIATSADDAATHSTGPALGTTTDDGAASVAVAVTRETWT